MEKPVSHEAYSTSQSSDSVESVATQITSESPLPPGKHVATALGCCNMFWTNIVHIELEQGELLLRNELYECMGAKGFDFFCFFKALFWFESLSDFATLLYSKCFIGN